MVDDIESAFSNYIEIKITSDIRDKAITPTDENIVSPEPTNCDARAFVMANLVVITTRIRVHCKQFFGFGPQNVI